MASTESGPSGRRRSGRVTRHRSAGLRIISVSMEEPAPGTAPEVHLREVADGLEACGHSVTRVWGSRSGRSGRLARVLAFQIGQLRPVLQADLVYVRWHVLLITHLLLARLLRRPYVLEVNGTDEDIALAHPGLRFMSKALRVLTRLQMAGAAHVIVVSPGLAEWVRDLTGGRVQVTTLPNGASSSLAAVRRCAQQPPYAVFVGELAPWQGLDTLLAARRSAAWPSYLDLVIVGSGTEERTVRSAADAGEVDYRGRLGRSEALELMAGATMSISVQTGRLARNRLGVTPLKIAESLMLGVPPIVSDLPGQADIVRSSPGGGVVPRTARIVLRVR